MKRQVARSKSCFRWIDGLNDQSKLVERLHFAEGGGLHAAVDQSLAANQQFVLQDQFQELGVAEVVAGRFLQAHLQRLGQAREAKLLERGLQRCHSWQMLLEHEEWSELRLNCLVKRSRALRGRNPTRDSRTWAEECPRRPGDRHRDRQGVSVARRGAGHSFVQPCLKKSRPRTGDCRGDGFAPRCAPVGRSRASGRMIGCSSRNGSGSCFGAACREAIAATFAAAMRRRSRAVSQARSRASVGCRLARLKKPLQHAHSFDSAGFQHGFGPAAGNAGRSARPSPAARPRPAPRR